MPNNRRRLRGTVTSDKMDKTVVVRVDRSKRHPVYKKVVRVSEKYMAHDENNEYKVGDFVQIVESRPLSRHKRWAVEKIIARQDEVVGTDTAAAPAETSAPVAEETTPTQGEN